MGDVTRHRLSSYDPRVDSSPGTEAHRPGYRNDPPGFEGVILDRRWGGEIRVCPCGCRRTVAGKARFAVGHDMRLKGILIRAHLTGTPLLVLASGGDPEWNGSAMQDAARWGTDKLDWQVMLKDAAARQANQAKTTETGSQ